MRKQKDLRGVKKINKEMKIEKKIILSVLVCLIMIGGVLAVSWNSPIDDFYGDEDSFYEYNVSKNVTNIGDNLTIFIDSLAEKPIEWNNGTNILNYSSLDFLPWFFYNSTNFIFSINITNDNQTGRFKIPFQVTDNNTEAGVNIFLYFNVTAVNDAPIFVNLENKIMNMSELFEYIVNVSDEENNIPFVLNISFLNCTVAEWSTRNCSNSSGRELFDSSDYNFNTTLGVLNISFIPGKNDVGSYVINFSVMDNSTLGNRTTSQVVNFTVMNTNSAPYFRYVCDNERNATEDSEFTCWVNASDIDETYNLTFSSNYAWFTFYDNSNLVTSLTIDCNGSTNYNASAMVNFTPTDVHVGNWGINISVTDIGSGFGVPKSNYSVFWFFINNTEDSVSLDAISDITIYENQTIYVNATDNDLLVTQKDIKNEILTFASNTSWVNISTYSSSSNYVMAKIDINFNGATTGNHTIKINVTDDLGSTAERTFIISVVANNAVDWLSMDDAFILYEGNLTYFNFTQNVSDANGDIITFSFTNDSAFQSFDIDSTTGVISFTAIDEDVGYHNIIINASDGKQDSLKSFNFTIRNINDAPSIIRLNESGVTNASVDANSNIIAVEDNLITITLWIQDDDIRIPSGQKSYYNESFNLDVNITGANSSLFSFSFNRLYLTTPGFTNITEYKAVFTPKKADIGTYNVTINVTDASNSTTSLEFNITISAIEHSPVLMSLTNKTSSINRNFYYRINATDVEDGNSSVSLGNSNFTFSYEFVSGVSFLNATNFNTTTGEINITFNSSQGGKYHINITVNDSADNQDLDGFWINVYDTPNITYPASNYIFNLAENNLFNLTFMVNHSIGDNLTFQIYIKNSNNSDVLKYNSSYYGDNTNLTWQFTPNFTEETYGVRNLTLIVLNPTYLDINFSKTFNITINHTNSPVVFSGPIDTLQASYGTDIIINLSNYFSDIDYSDAYYNQTVNFSALSNSTAGGITKSFSNWTLILSASTVVTEVLNITGVDSDSTNATSNNFRVKFIAPTTTVVLTPSSGGGGGSSSRTTPVAFKIITPGKVSAYASQKIIIPLSLENKGNNNFDKIDIISMAFKDGNIENKVTTSLDKEYIASLKIGDVEDLTLTIFFDTNDTGDYEILINATSQSPKYTDWTKIYIDLQELNNSDVRELLLFTEELIAENPECIEITEIVTEARKHLERGELIKAKEKAEQAISSCRDSISQSGLANLGLKSPLTTNGYLIVVTLSSMVLGISYYFIKRRRFKKFIISGEVT